MKKFLKTLVVGLCLFTLLCCALPAAFAADKTSGSKKEENVYAIGMDAQGGICSTVVTYTNLSGKLESTPEQPTMTGYTFDGWYFYRAAAHHPACRHPVAKVCRPCPCGRCPAYYPAGRHHVLNTAVNTMTPLKKGILP